MFRINSFLNRNRSLATKQSRYIRAFSSFLVAIIFIFVASFFHTAEAKDDDFSEDTINEVQQKINEKVDAMIKEIEGVRDGTRPPGKAGEKMDEIEELADLIEQIIESTESEYASDRITALGEFVKTLGKQVGERGDQFKPLGEMINGMGEATVGMGGSLKKIEKDRIEQRETWKQGWRSPEQYAKDKKDQHLAEMRRAIKKYEKSTESTRKDELHPECPEKCTAKYKRWEKAIDELGKKRRTRKKAQIAFREATSNYRSAREDFNNAQARLTAAQKELAEVEETAKDNAEMKIRKLGGRPAGGIESFMTNEEIKKIEAAKIEVKKFSDKRGLKQRFNNAKKRARTATDRLKAAKAQVVKAKKAEESAWSAYRECVKKCKKPNDKNADAKMKGKTAGNYQKIEVISVPSSGTVVKSKTVLKKGQSYKVVVKGTIGIGGPGDGLGDAEYADFSNPPKSIFDVCGYTGGTDFGIGIDDSVNDSAKEPRWGAYSSDHIYETKVTGKGQPLSLNYHDCNYGDNRGSFTVEIWGSTTLLLQHNTDSY